MRPILVNCEKISFNKTLGVLSFLTRLCTELSHECKLIFAIPDIDSFYSSPARSVIEAAAHDIILFDDAKCKTSLHDGKATELLPHHFQAPCFSDVSVLICHDLHVFDIGWKYNQVHKACDAFRQNLQKASAVVTHFPRTYYALEAVAGITIMNLFLTESPLLLNTSLPRRARNDINGIPVHKFNSAKVIEFIYPAQLQEHKNHETLISALAKSKQKGDNVRIICPGTSFKEQYTAELKNLASEQGVAGDIQFVGRLSDDDLRELYWHCDGVIVPSLAEGGSYIALEAIAAGKPVAVNSIDSAKQHIKSVAGEVIWFDATNIEKTEEAIRELASTDRNYWLEANATARERINQMTWDKVAEKWLAIFRWLSGDADRPWVHIDREGWHIELRPQ